MSKFSTYMRNAMASFLYRAQAFSPPAQLFVALHTSNPTSLGLTSTEVTGGGYQRVAISLGLAGVFADPPVDGLLKNTATIVQFPTPSDDWGVITHASLWDAASGGNMWKYNALSEPLPALIGDDVEFPVNKLMVLIE